jgi:hypothetical protein
MGANLKIVVGLLAAALCFAAGWKVNQYRTDSLLLAEVRGAELVAQAEREREHAISKTLEDKLSVLDNKTWVVFRDRNKIIEKPVYRNQCLDPDGVQLINAAKGGAAAGQHYGSVPTLTGSTGR